MPTATELTYASSAIDDLPGVWDGLAKLVGEGLGITAFGAQILDLPPNYTTDSHNETDSGQQELYVALSGHGAVIVHHDHHDEAVLIDQTKLAAIGPATNRTLQSGPAGLRVLCIGATPGQGYEPPDWTAGTD